jgi:hypothetical protein
MPSPIPTVEVDHPDSPGSVMIINESDFDPSAHRRFEDAGRERAGEKARAEAGAKAKADAEAKARAARKAKAEAGASPAGPQGGD